MPDMRLPFAACRNGDVVDALGGGTFVLDADGNRIAHFNHGTLEERWAAATQYAAFRNALAYPPEYGALKADDLQAAFDAGLPFRTVIPAPRGRA